MPMDGWGIMQQATELARRGEPFALATVVWRQAPSSSQQGAKALITADGELHGWIGGACAEPTVIRAAARRNPAPATASCCCSVTPTSSVTRRRPASCPRA